MINEPQDPTAHETIVAPAAPEVSETIERAAAPDTVETAEAAAAPEAVETAETVTATRTVTATKTVTATRTVTATNTPASAKEDAGPSPVQRRWIAALAVLFSGIIAAVLIGALPVLTLSEFFEKTDLGSIDPAKEGLRIVYTSSSLWFVAIGGALALISFFVAALDLTNKWVNFWLNQIPAVASATFILIGGLFLVVKP